MHILAYTYHWGFNEVECMPIKKRRKWLEQVEKQQELEQEAIDKAKGKVPMPKGASADDYNADAV